SGFFNSGTGGTSGFGNVGSGGSGFWNIAGNLGNSGFLNVGPLTSGILNFGNTVSGLYNTSTLGLATSAFHSGVGNTDSQLAGFMRNAAGGTLFNFGFANDGTLNLGNANLGDY
ncbi:hypothetical protein BWP20_22465, partial [Mycobacterium tuberculosis]